MTEIRFRVDPGPRGSVALDPVQRSVLELPLGASAAVIGAPGSGKTTVLRELLADRVARPGWSADAALVLAPSRAGATRLRDAVALRLGVPTDGPRVRTVPSLAFELVTSAARQAGRPAPRLITGGEQDLDIAALLEEQAGDDVGGAVPWPPELGPRVRALRAFRTELRELLGRATEHGLTPTDVAALGERSRRPEWVAAGRFLEVYLDVVASARPDQLDSAELAQFAVRAIADGTAGPRVDALRLVLVDDLQEATESTIAVLRALAGRGIPIVAFGDPDVAANAFRGGDPTTLGQLGSRLGVPVQEIVLDRVHRHPAGIRHLVSAATARIGTAAAGRQRIAEVAPPDAGAAPGEAGAHPPVERITALSPAREAAAIARALREAHLVEGVPWGRMAVVVRSGGRVPGLARSLTLADVPTRGGSGGIALRDDGAARALLTLVDVGIGRAPLDPGSAEVLLLGPFGGLDPLALRRLRRALRAEELAGDGLRPGTELVAEALGDPARLATIDSRSGREATRLAETLRMLRQSDGSIEDLLWLAWDRSGLAEPWRRQALGHGLAAAEAGRRLDGVVALFTAAKRFAERRPDAPAAEFLAEVLDAEVPEDILLPRAVDDAVLVAPPSALVGVEVELVVIAGLQQGVWPNLRPRGTLLAPQRLAAALEADAALAASPALDEREAVLHDELRMFALAVSRASRRVLLTAVANEEEQPSPLLRLGAAPGEEPLPVDAAPGTGAEELRLPLSLRGAVGRLRRIAANGDSRRRSQAAATLARLAAEGVPGAHPAEWLGLLPVSTDRPLHEGDPVPVSPSGIDRLEQSPLDWFLDQVAGGDPGTAANVGTIVHWAMETASDPGIDAVWSAIESRWSELVFDAPWLAERQRRLTRVLAEGLSEYLTEFAGSGKVLVGAERRFRLELGEAIVSGSIDRVERAADGSVVIVDLKTGSAITKADEVAAHPQLGSYQLAYAQGVLDEALAVHGEHSGGGAKLLFVKGGVKGRRYREAMQQVLGPEEVEAVRARLVAASRLIAAAEFRGLVELDDRGGMWDLSSYRLHRTGEVTSD